MTKLFWCIGGLLVSAFTVLLVGFLSIQIAGLRGGAVFGLDNQLVAVTEPGPGFVQMLATLAIGVASLAVIGPAMRSRLPSTRLVFRAGFVLGMLVLIAVGISLTAQGFVVPSLNVPKPQWVEGWVINGGTNPAIHLVFIIAIYVLLSGRRDRTSSQAAKNGTEVSAS